MYHFFKRVFDLVLSFALLVLSLPITIITILLIVIIDMQNPFFFQERSGIKGKKIYIIKFQTMKLINGKKNFYKTWKNFKINKN